MLDPDIVAFIQSGVSIGVAGAGPDRMPVMSRGFGCRAIDGGRQVAVFVGRAQAAELLDHLRANGRVANVFSLPSSNRTVQLKGEDARVLPFDAADLAVIAEHIEAFVAQVVPLGTPQAIVRTMFAHTAEDLATVVYTPSTAYFQTPGPRAGAPIGAQR